MPQRSMRAHGNGRVPGGSQPRVTWLLDNGRWGLKAGRDPGDAESEDRDGLEQETRLPAGAPAGRPQAGIQGQAPRNEDQAAAREIEAAAAASLKNVPCSGQQGPESVWSRSHRSCAGLGVAGE